MEHRSFRPIGQYFILTYINAKFDVPRTNKARILCSHVGVGIMYKNILVPVVVGEGQDAQASFSLARALADEGAKFTVLHVMEAIPGFVAAEIPDGVLAQMHQKIENLLVESAKALPGASTQLKSGHAGTTIVEYANKNGIDCIIIASHKPGVEDFFLGSTAARVVRHATCSVHVIR
jgi:universal stress protein F